MPCAICPVLNVPLFLLICFPELSRANINMLALSAYSPTRPATPTPSATTSATLDRSFPLPAAPPLPCVAVALGPAVLVSPDKLPVVPVGLIAVVVLATEVRLLPTLAVVVVVAEDMVMVPVAVGDDVSVDGTVKPGLVTLVKGMETKGAALRGSLLLWRSRSRGSGPGSPSARSQAVAVGARGREQKRSAERRTFIFMVGELAIRKGYARLINKPGQSIRVKAACGWLFTLMEEVTSAVAIQQQEEHTLRLRFCKSADLQPF